MLIQCCVCRRFREEDRWVAVERRPKEGERLSHSYCPECAERAFQEIRAHRLALGGKTVKVPPTLPISRAV